MRWRFSAFDNETGSALTCTYVILVVVVADTGSMLCNVGGVLGGYGPSPQPELKISDERVER